MAKELMEIGGFITSGAEIVNHDNSLSGNGTVESPLGVLPGYNETVLWSGTLTCSANASFTLSEPLTAFDKVQFYVTRNSSIAPKSNEFIITANNSTYSVMNTFTENPTVWCDWCDIAMTGISGRCIQPIRKQLASSSIATQTTAPLSLIRVIGINRKA